MIRFDPRRACAVPLFLLAQAWGVPAFAAETAPSAPAVRIDEYREHVERLASDEFGGRKPGTAAETKTVAYLVEQFQKLGLKPGNGGSYTQGVPLVEITAGSDATLTFDTPKGPQSTTIGEDAVVFSKQLVPQVSFKGSPVVFVGHGVVAPEYGWNDYAGLDMRGKTALILINDPGFATGDESLFRGRAMTYYGRWTYKYEEAARQGADAAIIVHETKPAAYGWTTVVNSWDGPQMDMGSGDSNLGRAKVEAWVTLDRAKALVAASGQDFDALKLAANQRGFKPVALPGVSASAFVRSAIRKSTSSNVVATIPGSKRPNEYVVYMAHWDHLGRTLGKKGDTIYNGAEDNATGVAGLLAIASAFKRAPTPPERTVVFLSVTAEEDGLLGSAYYAQHPLFPLAQTVAALNMDSIYFGGPTRDVSVVGAGASELEKYLVEAAAAQDRVVIAEPEPEMGLYYRSDHFNFAKYGVPGLYFKLGVDDRACGEACGRARLAEYFAKRYHQVSDNYDPTADLRGGAQDVELMYRVGAKLADETTWPNWLPDNEFRAIRDRSRAGAPN